MSPKSISILAFLFSLSFAEVSLGSSAKVTLKWVDEDGKPVPNVRVGAGFEGDKTEIKQTDTNGVCTFKGKTYCGEIAYNAKPDGYYYSEGRYNFSAVTNGDWQPWNPVVTTVVRRIVNPIPMYAKTIETSIPSTNQDYGFDLKVGDWVQPSGKGNVSDLIFRIDGFWKDYRENDSTLVISFSHLSDGIIPCDYPLMQGSQLVLPREAPSDGYQFRDKWHRARKRMEGQGKDVIVDDLELGLHYVFRVRSITNENGVVTNAYYGKMPCKIDFVGANQDGNGKSWLKFTYYLNPTPNDRNLEFDTKRNLFRNWTTPEP